MASLEPKVLLDKTQEDVEGADGFVYKGLPAAIRDGLEEMWAEETTNKRKKALRAWDAKVRLAIKLGQAAVPLPPICAELQRERMTSKPVAVASGGAGWGQADRPVGHRQEAVKQTGWAGVPGATVVQRMGFFFKYSHFFSLLGAHISVSKKCGLRLMVGNYEKT